MDDVSQIKDFINSLNLIVFTETAFYHIYCLFITIKLWRTKAFETHN